MLDPLTLEGLRAKAGAGPVLVALSGGGDSVALMHVLADALGAARLRAVIVDHQLRTGSAQDAQRAATFAEQVGVTAEVVPLIWSGANRAHEAARDLRYAALAAAARKAGATVIATGHTRDDQAETVLMRAARDSGVRGLAGMSALAPLPLWPHGRGLWLARPLLSTRREPLRELLRARGGEWIEDPANANALYTRVRARQALADMEREGLDPMRLASLAERLQPHVRAIDEAAAALIAAAARFADGEISIDRTLWSADGEIARRALQALITAAGAQQRAPSPAQIEPLAAALTQSSFTGATLAGVQLGPRETSIILRRDRGALVGRAGGAPPMPPLPLAPNVPTVWDKRVVLTMPEQGWSVAVEDGAPLLARDAERRPLAAASPNWIVKDRARHVLGMD